MIEIWLGENEKLYQECNLEEVEKKLSPERRKKYAQSKGTETKKQSLVAGALLEQYIQKQTGWENVSYTYSDRGKPYIKESSAHHISLSHCRDYSAAVVAKQPIGVDVESFGRGKENMIKRFFSPKEMTFFQESEDKDLTFALFWTVKEAVAKCLDYNLMQVCQQVDVSAVIPGLLEKTCMLLVPEQGMIYVRSFLVQGCVVSCASVIEEDFSLKRIDKL